MSVELVRPNVSDLVLRAYGRALHPDLFEHHSGLILTTSRMKLEVRLNASGHVLMLRMDSATFTEVLADSRAPLPSRCRLVDHRLRGSRNESARLDNGLQYDLSCQVERLQLDIFLKIDAELEEDCERAELSARLPAINRFLPGPLSVVRAEISRDSMLIYAFHTFPEHCAIVKTQSLFEFNS